MERRNGKMSVGQDGKVICPCCRQMTLARVEPGGGIHAYLYCRHCKKEIKINIDMSLSP